MYVVVFYCDRLYVYDAAAAAAAAFPFCRHSQNTKSHRHHLGARPATMKPTSGPEKNNDCELLKDISGKNNNFFFSKSTSFSLLPLSVWLAVSVCHCGFLAGWCVHVCAYSNMHSTGLKTTKATFPYCFHLKFFGALFCRLLYCR